MDFFATPTVIAARAASLNPAARNAATPVEEREARVFNWPRAESPEILWTPVATGVAIERVRSTERGRDDRGNRGRDGGGDYRRSGNEARPNIRALSGPATMAPGPAPSSRWRAAVLADATKNSVHQRTGRFEHPLCSGVARHASVTPAPCDCNTAESETDDREGSRLNL